jgi:hypothetical protein
MGATIYIRLAVFLLAIITAFHLCLLVKLVPYGIVWGGRLKSDNEMYAFEAISIIMNLFLIVLLLMKGHYLRFAFNEKLVNVVLWVFFLIFILNTIGNLAAKTSIEKGFSIVTFLLAILMWKVLKGKESSVINNR